MVHMINNFNIEFDSDEEEEKEEEEKNKKSKKNIKEKGYLSEGDFFITKSKYTNCNR